MGNSQNISDTKFLSKYIQFETASSSLTQFFDKWQLNRMQNCKRIEDSSLFPHRLFFQNQIC